MSEKQTENNIDEIFRKGIEPLNTEPSDEFWRKSAESIIRNGKTPDTGNASRWKTIAFLLALCLLFLGYFTIRMQNGIDHVNPKIAEVKNQDSKTIGRSAIVSKNTIALPVKGSQKELKQLTSAHNYNVEKAKTQSKPFTKALILNKAINPSVAATINKQSHHPKSKQPTSVLLASNSSRNTAYIKPSTDESTLVIQRTGNNTSDPGKGPDSTVAFKIKSNPPDNGLELKRLPNKTDSTVPAHTLKALPERDSAASTFSSRFSLAANFSTDILIAYNFKSSGTIADQYESAIKMGEKEQFSYTASVKAEYELSSRFSINAGLSYQSFSYNIAPQYLYAQKRSDGDVGYSFVTSSGVINCPYYPNTYMGDSLKMGATSTRSYLCFPVQLKYYALKTRKLGIYIEGGPGINFSTGSQTVMNWQGNYWQPNGTASVSGVEGLQSIYYSYSAGVGGNFYVTNRIGLNAGLTLQGSLTPINKNTPVVSYPYLLGINVGLIYHFK